MAAAGRTSPRSPFRSGRRQLVQYPEQLGEAVDRAPADRRQQARLVDEQEAGGLVAVDRPPEPGLDPLDQRTAAGQLSGPRRLHARPGQQLEVEALAEEVLDARLRAAGDLGER